MHPVNGGGLENNWEETIFSWRYGNTNFIFLNSEENGFEGRISENQLVWFENAVQESGFDNKFVICHRALVGSIRTTCGALQGLDPNMSACLDKLMYDNNVTAGLYSHDHYYAYVTTHDGNMPHIISGGAGAVLRPCTYVPEPNEFGDGCKTTISVEPNCISGKWHYIIIDVNNSSITGTVYDNNEVEIHHFEI